jgi:protein O-mannosyl-transferase
MPNKRNRVAHSQRRRPEARTVRKPVAKGFPSREDLLLAAVLLVTLLVYLRSLSNGFVYDDRPLILENASIADPRFIWRSLFQAEYWFRDPANQGPNFARYRPLMAVWMALNYSLFGFNPIGWHAAGAGLHLLGVWLVFKIATRLTGRWQPGLYAALVFGLLPTHAEAVSWSAANSDLLASLLALAAFYCYTRLPRDQRRARLPAPMLFGAAILSHEMVAAFPALIGLYVFLFDPAGDEAAPATIAGRALTRRLRRALASMAPFLGVLALYFIARRNALGFWLSNPGTPANHATAAQVLMTIPWALASYLFGMALPRSAFFHHYVLFVTTPLSPHFYVPLVMLALVSAAFLFAIRNRPSGRLYLFCAGWTLIALGPMMDLFALPDDALVTDGYMYLASFGWCLLLSCWLGEWSLRRPSRRPVAQGLGFAVAAAYAAALWQTQYLFHDDLTLYRRGAENFPASPRFRAALARALARQGDLAGAQRELQNSRALGLQDSDTLYESAVIDMQLGQIKQAAGEAADAIKIDPRPLAREYVLLAKLDDAQEQRLEAEAALKQAESLPGGIEAAAVARAQIALRHGDLQSAETILRAASQRFPDDVLLWMQLGVTQARQARYAESLSAFGRALELAPNDSSLHLLMAGALHALGRDSEALSQCRLALSAAPDDPNARALMALIERRSASP